MRLTFFIYIILQCIPAAGLFSQNAIFNQRIDKGQLQSDLINEASGLAFSRINQDVLWTHNDSGGFPHLYAISDHGIYLGKIIFIGISNRDWEDVAIGPGPVVGKSYLYVADIGDNEEQYRTKVIYRFPEPDLTQMQHEKMIIHQKDISAIRFRYPDGNFDAETLLLDPQSQSLYVMTKMASRSRLYKIENTPSKQDDIQTARFVHEIPLHKLTGGEISADGSEIIVKNYFFVYYWKLGDTAFEEGILKSPTLLPYMPEPQGEAICFDFKNRGYYSLSEERGGAKAHLYFYPRVQIK